MAAFLFTNIVIAGSIFWSCLSHNHYAAEPRNAEQFKLVYITNTGEDAEVELNKASATGWRFKAALGDKTKVVIFTK